MLPDDIFEFAESLRRIESFFSELAARDSEIGYAGLGSARLWESYRDTAEEFTGFDKKIHEVIRISKFIDTSLHDRISSIISESELAEGIVQVAVSVKIAEMRQERSIAIRKAYVSTLSVTSELIGKYISLKSLAGPRSLSFKEFDVSLSRLLVALNRLIPLVEDVAEHYYRKRDNDSEAFKPSNIDLFQINIYLENGIIALQNANELGPETKAQLIEYLGEIRAELANESPKWKKIVGGLVIVSTILGGVAVAPQAYDVVQDALKAILGTSIEKQYPHSVPDDIDGLPKLILA